MIDHGQIKGASIGGIDRGMRQRRHVGTLGDPQPRLDRGRGNEPKKGRDPEGAVEVGLVHSRGKAGVTAGEPARALEGTSEDA